MNTISARARRPLRPIALRLVGTWRGVRIDVTKVDREAPGGPPARVVGGTSGLPEGGSELGVDTPAGDVGTKVLRETSVDVCGLSEALSATDSVADRAPWVVGQNGTGTGRDRVGSTVVAVSPKKT